MVVGTVHTLVKPSISIFVYVWIDHVIMLYLQLPLTNWFQFTATIPVILV